jgi:ferredoxin
MCEFCAKHGEGRKWYLRARNYSADLVKNSRRFRDMLQSLLTKTYPDNPGLAAARTFLRLPLVGRAARRMATHRMKRDHFGQVLAIEDVRNVFRLADTITLYPCVCRRTLGVGRDQRFCFVLGNFMRELLDDSPDFGSTRGERLTPEQASRRVAEFDREGLVHTIWTIDTPFIVGICSCRPGECLAMEMTNELQTKVMFKAEHLFEIDETLCTGCEKCMETCYFRAIEPSNGDGVCRVDSTRCYGCGLCRAACPLDAPRRAGAPAVF